MFGRTLRVLVFFAVAFFLGRDAHAQAQSPSGTWRADTGSTFIIPLVTGNEFDMVLVQPNGTKELRHAAWVQGMEGTQFAYRLGAVTKTATFNAANPDRMVLASSDGAPNLFWTRLRHPEFGWRGILGTWKSTSGNTFVVVDRGRTFHIILTAPNGARTLLEASWIPGMEGTQFNYTMNNTRNVGTRMPRDENQIRMESGNGQVNSWTRIN